MNKKLMILPLMGLFVLLSLSVISAEPNATSSNITIVLPGASAMMTGDYSFNVTLDLGLESLNYSQLKVYLYSASETANTTQYLIGTFNSLNADNRTFDNDTIDTTLFQNGDDYVIIAEIANGTVSLNQTRTGLSIDNGVPSAYWGTTSATDTAQYTSTQSFTISAVANYTVGIANGTIEMNGVNQTLTGSASACSGSFTASDFNLETVNNVFTYWIYVTDNLGNESAMVSSNRTLKIYDGGGGSVSTTTTTTTSSDETDTTIDSDTEQDSGVGQGITGKISDFFKGIGNWFKDINWTFWN